MLNWVKVWLWNDDCCSYVILQIYMLINNIYMPNICRGRRIAPIHLDTM